MSGAAPVEFVTGFYVGFLSWPILKIVGLYVADLISDCVLRPYKPAEVPSLEATFRDSYKGSMFDASSSVEDSCEPDDATGNASLDSSDDLDNDESDARQAAEILVSMKKEN
jgi:hypothetical protein